MLHNFLEILSVKRAFRQTQEKKQVKGLIFFALEIKL